MFQMRSERIGMSCSLNCDPAQLGEVFPIGGAANVAAIAGTTASPKRIDALVVHSLVVDVQHPGIQTFADAHGATGIRTDDARRETVFGIVGQTDAFLLLVVGEDGAEVPSAKQSA